MKAVLLAVALGSILLLAVILGLRTWIGMADVEIGFHGMAALVLGVVLSLALGIGLMALVFYSSRAGHDERAHEPPDEP